MGLGGGVERSKAENHKWKVKEVWPCGFKVCERKGFFFHKKFHHLRGKLQAAAGLLYVVQRFYCISLHVSCVTSASWPGKNKQELRLQLQRLQTEVSRCGNIVIYLELVFTRAAFSSEKCFGHKSFQLFTWSRLTGNIIKPDASEKRASANYLNLRPN